MTVKERLIHYLERKGIKHKEFNEKVGVSKGYIGAISKSPSNSVLNRISIHFPDLSIEWLTTGKGNMLNNSGYEAENVARKFTELNSDYEVNNQNDSITIPREVFDMISRLTETVQSQQRIIDIELKEIRKALKKTHSKSGNCDADIASAV
ncbi:MAG: helix-turn-helix transcriptional regulator [Bacteroidales bacterium]|nr:helix-turn-helix transcriptional regulator [Bacteroidales bacterium]